MKSRVYKVIKSSYIGECSQYVDSQCQGISLSIIWTWSILFLVENLEESGAFLPVNKMLFWWLYERYLGVMMMEAWHLMALVRILYQGRTCCNMSQLHTVSLKWLMGYWVIKSPEVINLLFNIVSHLYINI